jgi:hypothetical protein
MNALEKKLSELREEFKKTTDPIVRQELIKRANNAKRIYESIERGSSKFQAQYQYKARA